MFTYRTRGVSSIGSSGDAALDTWGEASFTGTIGDEFEGRYLLAITFTSYEAFTYWRQVEEEGPDYWEQLAQPIEEYHGEIAVDALIMMQ